ncbi:MAG: gluconokinase [Chloroflexi bacterium]|nr:gluconokinase [Chloroflexota bacterium]MCI0646826.1 gluconokinase [Chloroflexota bacterium]MCI0728128.1 gluconokinase [Chloroflexota bacterium]
MIILLMGVSGAGKTTIGRLLAEELAWPFYDADDFHPPANVAKMSQGLPLTDADRDAWLAALQQLIRQLLVQDQPAVIACSALKAAYRARLLANHPGVYLVYLKGSYDLIYRRLQDRPGHFMPPDLLASQFATLEEPQDALVVSIDQEPEEIVKAIVQSIAI